MSTDPLVDLLAFHQSTSRFRDCGNHVDESSACDPDNPCHHEGYCTCLAVTYAKDTPREHRAHLAAVIREAGYDRAEAEPDLIEGDTISEWAARAEKAETERDGWHEAFDDRLAELQGYAGALANLTARIEALADEWADEYVPTDSGWVEVCLRDLRAVLTATDKDALNAAKAEAWDEGFDAGQQWGRRVNAPYPHNPYRKEA